MCRIIEIRQEREIDLDKAEALLNNAIKKHSQNNDKKEFDNSSGNHNQVNNQYVTRYAAVAFENEILELSMTVEGGSNTALNKAAFTLGRFIGGGQLNQLEVEKELTRIAYTIGLENQEVESTIKNGISSGMLQPRAGPNLPQARQSSTGSTDWTPTLEPATKSES